MEQMKQEFLDLSDKFYARFTARIDDLTDEEYWWEPAPDCWTLRPDRDGKLRPQWGLVFDDPAPVTTIAWRYSHVSDLLSEDRCATWIGLEAEPDDYFADGFPGDAVNAREAFEKSFARWKRYLSAADESTFAEKVGPVARMFADRTRAQFILHILDEVIHHGAEIGVLRDIYRAQRTYEADVSALLRGEELDAGALERVKTSHPKLVLRAAELAYWDAIPRLLALGFGIDGKEGRTPLHHAAAEGRTDLIRLLLDAGADVEAKDPVYKATPKTWAEFFDRKEAAELLQAAKTS